jgi:hypothetical protein
VPPGRPRLQREVERHTAIEERLAQLLDQLGASAAG